MANVHGINDLNNNRPQNNGLRQPMIGGGQDSSP